MKEDCSPAWLHASTPNTKIVIVPIDVIERAFDYEVDVSGLEMSDYPLTHRNVEPKKKRWTVKSLQRKKATLLLQIEKERAKHVEVDRLRDECIELAEELERLKSQRTSVGYSYKTHQIQ